MKDINLPANPYKSIQVVLSQMEYSCVKEYIKRMENHLLKPNK